MSAQKQSIHQNDTLLRCALHPAKQHWAGPVVAVARAIASTAMRFIASASAPTLGRQPDINAQSVKEGPEFGHVL